MDDDQLNQLYENPAFFLSELINELEPDHGEPFSSVITYCVTSGDLEQYEFDDVGIGSFDFQEGSTIIFNGDFTTSVDASFDKYSAHFSYLEIDPIRGVESGEKLMFEKTFDANVSDEHIQRHGHSRESVNLIRALIDTFFTFQYSSFISAEGHRATPDFARTYLVAQFLADELSKFRGCDCELSGMFAELMSTAEDFDWPIRVTSSDELGLSLDSCPDCGMPLRNVIKALPSSDTELNDFPALPEFATDEPQRYCSDCGWEGGAGGRGFPTNWRSKKIDLVTATLEELWAFGVKMPEARFELAFRGIPHDEIELGFKWSLPMPVTLHFERLTFVEVDSRRILITLEFEAHGSSHRVRAMQLGYSDFKEIRSTLDFNELIDSFSSKKYTVWSSEALHEKYSFSPAPKILAKTQSGEPISEAELRSEAEAHSLRLSKPYWFELGLRIN